MTSQKLIGQAGASSKERSLGSSWFNDSGSLPPSSDRAPVSLPPGSSAPLGEVDGDPTWAFILGGLGGGVGGAAMMLVAAELGRRLRHDVDIIRTVGHAARGFGDSPFGVGIAVAVAMGIVVGTFFGALMRHTVRLTARLIAGVMLAVVLWTFVHAFVLKSLAPTSLGALPFGPLIAGAVVFGLIIAVLRPPRRRWKPRTP
jgi:hypothetical protein